MQLSNRRKAFYITISILISFVFWFYVNNGAEIDLAISEVPVEFYNAESALANKGLVLVGGDENVEELVLTMPRSLSYRFDTDHLRLVADLSSVNSTGTQSLRYSVIYPPGINPSQVSVKSPSVQTVSVRVGELFRKNDVEIRCKLVGNVADGFVAGRVQLLPEALEIWGQQSDVMQVNYAQVTLNIENARSTIVQLVEFELYDFNDQLIENKAIHSASDTIQVTMPVISATDIPLVVRFKEAPGVRIDSFDWTLDTKTITLSGDANQIAQIGEIELGEVDLTTIDSEQTFTYQIPVPDGLTNLSGVSSATLTISNRDVETRELTVTDFEYENFGSENRTVEVVTSSLTVRLRGPKATLERLDSGSIRAVADLSGVIDASGTYTVPANIRIEGDPDVGPTESYQLTVRIGSHAAEQEQEEQREQQEQSSGAEEENEA